MDPLTWRRIEAIAAGALDRRGDARAAWIAAMCVDRPALADEVTDLLRSLEQAPDFLETPALERATPTSVPTEPAAGALAPGTIVGPYVVHELVGEGGMGEVYRATRDVDGAAHRVAIKVVRRGHAPDADDRFRRERRLLATLDHPHIARFLDAGMLADGHPYVVVEFVDGDVITRVADARALDVDGRLRLLVAVGEAVEHAHQRLVVHRDLKPGNILVTAAGVPKLLDFGIGKLLGEEDTDDPPLATGEDARRLTPDYAAPEQRRGEPITTAVDVYALGVLLVELLTGQRPRVPSAADASETPRQARPSILTAENAASRVPSRALRGDLDAIARRALAPHPGDRYPSAAAFVDDLRRAMDGRPVIARQGAPLYRAWRFARRHRTSVASAFVVIGALTSLAVGSANQARRVREEADRARVERDKARRVQGFLMEMFGSTGSERAVGDTLTVRALLDLERARLTTASPSTSDDERADMLAVLADGYDRLGFPGDAEPLAREALALRRTGGNRTRPADLAEALRLAGWIAHQRGQFAAADSLLTASRDVWRTLAVPDSAGESRALNDLGVLYNATKRHQEAVALLRTALAMRQGASAGDDRPVGITANNLAAAFYFLQQLDSAVSTQAIAVRALTNAFGATHQRTIVARSNLATFRRVQGDLEGAEAEFRLLAAQQARLQGAEHPVTARLQSALATVLAARAARPGPRLQREALALEADRLYTGAIDALRRRLGADHPQVRDWTARRSALRDSIAARRR